MADVLYHSMVLLVLRVVRMEDVVEVLGQRFFSVGYRRKEKLHLIKLGINGLPVCTYIPLPLLMNSQELCCNNFLSGKKQQ